jgi:SH3-like domain-containing protein
MRRNAIWIVLVCFSFGAAASAQTPPYDAEIKQRVAEVRGGQSSIYPVTNRLSAGTRVRVKREEGTWLAISPPQGSSSWVMERFLDQQPTVGRATICTIVGDDAAVVPVLLGSADQPAPIANQIATLKRGTLVVVLGERATSDALGDRTTWWRIQPTATEVRWLPKESIQASTAFAPVPPMNTARAYGNPVPELWTMAEQAERNGNSSLAAVYYRQLAAQQSMPGGDYNLAAQATARADALNRRNATTTSRPSYSPPGVATTGDTNGPWSAGVVYTSGPGYLRRVAFLIDNQTTYALEDDRGYPRLYVVAQPGLNLEPFANRRVELFGPMVNRQDMTVRGFMSVKTVHVLR